jgi:hypothetical protein
MRCTLAALAFTCAVASCGDEVPPSKPAGQEAVFLPDGSRFTFWSDTTNYTRTYHVAQSNPAASDDNPGTLEKPFKTIQHAAELLQPGERVRVHAGIYREWVRPVRSGGGPDQMIAYEAAPGEAVTVCGSELWKPQFVKSSGWELGRVPDGVTVWMGDLPLEKFGGYNPFSIRNLFTEFRTFGVNWSANETTRLLLKRGMVYCSGRPLKQVFLPFDLALGAGSFWIEEPGRRIHFRLPNDADPNAETLEITAREQVFAPDIRHLGFIRVSGFSFQHAADGIPVPQRAMVSTSRGHHWIIENNSMRFANCECLDIGAQHWSPERYDPKGGHIVRGNTISDCGICGIAGVTHVDNTLIEDNRVERVGGLDLERVYENAGMKFHYAQGMLIRRNTFRDIHHACGLWLDGMNANTRVSGNQFIDISTFAGACYVEVSHDPNMIDNNFFWNIHGELWDKGNAGAGSRGGNAVKSDSSDYTTVANNFFGEVADSAAIDLGLDQDQRIVEGRTGLCRRVNILNNIIVHSAKRVELGRVEENACDGNLYDSSGDPASFIVEHPDPRSSQTLSAWRDYYGFDRHSAQAVLQAEYEGKNATLSLIRNEKTVWPEPQAVSQLHENARRAIGPLTEDQWQTLVKTGTIKFLLFEK